jgi:hypothetical protein
MPSSLYTRGSDVSQFRLLCCLHRLKGAIPSSQSKELGRDRHDLSHEEQSQADSVHISVQYLTFWSEEGCRTSGLD